MLGPVPIARSAFSAGMDQAHDTPAEWQQGTQGYGMRFASHFGMAATSTTTRFALAQALKEDTFYYRCECRGAPPRLGHAVISTLTARRGEDGYRVFSIPAVVAPYAGTMTAVYGWYPSRYDAKDAFRMGNYSLLGHVVGNIAQESSFSGPHSLLSRMRSKKEHAAPDPAS